MTELPRALSEAFLSGGRSTALRPLGWLIGLTVTGAISGSHWGAPGWIVALLGVSAGLAVLAYLYAYFYFLLKDKDCLRSERYSIRKREIEHGLLGDDLSGMRRVQRAEVIQPSLPQSSNRQEQGE